VILSGLIRRVTLEGGKMTGWLKTNIIGTSMKDSAKEFKWFIIVAEIIYS
jgi:hypothetical protein